MLLCLAHRYLNSAEVLNGEEWEDAQETSLPVRLAHMAVTTL